MLGMSIQAAAIMWQVYELTESPLALAFVGIARFVPSLALSFLAGAITDIRDRGTVLRVSLLVPLATSALLAALTFAGDIGLTAIYASVVFLGVAGAFEGPSRQSLLPLVVPPQSFQRAVALATIVQQLAGVFGPAVAGLMIAQSGVAPAYVFHAALVVTGLICLGGIRVDTRGQAGGGLSFAMIREGLAFVRAHPPILGAMALDMIAVIFAGADALLPVYAKEILDSGAVGYGLLTSSKAVGSLLAAATLALLPPVVATGRTLIIMIALFGLGTVAFGFSTSLPLSLLLYAAIAAVDQVSVVLRQSIILLGTPNELRGRVSSVNQVFVGASNQLGAAESGIVATWANSAVFAVVSGGVACLIGVAVMSILIPGLWRHREGAQPAEESSRDRGT
jgi:MFS family permease